MNASNRVSLRKPPATRRSRLIDVAAAVLVGALVFFAWAKGRGIKTAAVDWVLGRERPQRPTVTASRPADNDGNVRGDVFVAADVRLPNPGKVIDANTITDESVRLFRTADKDRTPIPAVRNTTGGCDAVVVKPLQPLEPNTQYTFQITPGLCDTGGTPFEFYSVRFTTAPEGGAISYPVAFEKVALPVTAEQIYTSVTIGPDGRLYAGTFDGRILRFDIRADGTLDRPHTINAIPSANGGAPRLLIGMCFDPASTAQIPILYATHSELPLGPPETTAGTDWTGKVSRLSGPDLGDCRDVVVGLPRATRDHLTNQIQFGPDGALYFPQASNTAMGAPDPNWGDRPERLLTAAILRLDLTKLPADGAPLDARTQDGGGSYDPSAPRAPLTVYATGVRNAYDLAWHSNGHLYAPINSSAAGGNTPAGDDPVVPAITGVRQTVDDYLLRVEPGGYYGHPNPLRGQFVLGGGNPTAAADPDEVSQYPVGTPPDPAWRRPSWSFGKNLAPTGIIEYRSARPFAGRLRGKLLVTRYSGGDDVVVLTPGEGGAVAECLSGVDGLTQLNDPLDLCEDQRTGNLYVAEYGAKRITLLRPAEGVQSARVYRQTAGGGAGQSTAQAQ